MKKKKMTNNVRARISLSLWGEEEGRRENQAIYFGDKELDEGTTCKTMRLDNT